MERKRGGKGRACIAACWCAALLLMGGATFMAGFDARVAGRLRP